jgi:hypothetical protein
MKKLIFAISSLPFIVSPAFSGSSLMLAEVQALAGYLRSQNKIIYHSGHAQEPMQKNAVGIDFVKKFSSLTGDFLTAALQLRLAYDDNENKAQLQVYNAYLKAKISFGDVWAGHNRAAFGLESYWDTHGALLQSLPMYGSGYDRDWGLGFSKDTKNGGVSLSFTSASGMGLKLDGSFLIASRFSKGVLNYDNYTAGISVMAGKAYDAMGYEIMNAHPYELYMFAADFAYNVNNVEQKFQINAGKKTGEDAFAGLYRLTLNFLEENKLKLEGQGVYTQTGKFHDYFLSAGAAYSVNPDITARIMYEYGKESGGRADDKIVAQLYYYFVL